MKYTTSTEKNVNQASKYASSIIKSEIALVDSTLMNDYQTLIKNGCFYLPYFFCEKSYDSIFKKLKEEIKMDSVLNWSKHFKFEDPECSKTFNEIVKKMAEHFKVEIVQTRLNYYCDGNDFKPMHKDRHAYGAIKENFTMGASFGASRNLDFFHEASKNKFSFPQNNGDVFAFNSDVNKAFLHGVPKANQNVDERFSIIAWGSIKQ